MFLTKFVMQKVDTEMGYNWKPKSINVHKFWNKFKSEFQCRFEFCSLILNLDGRFCRSFSILLCFSVLLFWICSFVFFSLCCYHGISAIYLKYITLYLMLRIPICTCSAVSQLIHFMCLRQNFWTNTICPITVQYGCVILLWSSPHYQKKIRPEWELSDT